VSIYLYGGLTDGSDGGDLRGLDVEMADDEDDDDDGVATFERRCCGWCPPPSILCINTVKNAKPVETLFFQ